MNSFLQIMLLSFGLAMDAFSVSIVLGIETKKQRLQSMFKVAITFAFFQGAMPLIGYAIGKSLQESFDKYSGQIAFVLLLVIGIKILLDNRKESNERRFNEVTLIALLSLGIATSIDALIAGTTLTLLEIPMWISVGIIASITFMLSGFGFWFGNKIGNKFGSRIEIAGALFLIFLGVTFLFN